MKQRKEKLKRFVEKRNLNPMNNRKKVGIILFATSIGLFFLFAARLAYIVIGGHVDGVSLAQKTEELYQGSKEIEAKRGAIYDRLGNSIAENSVTYKLKAILSDTYVSGKTKLYAQQKDFNTLALILHENLDISTEDALARLEAGVNADGTTQYQVEFGNKGRNISLEKRKSIEDAMGNAGVKGLYFDEYSDRIYPNSVFSSHLIGYAGPANAEDEASEITGQFGIERAYNTLLSGTNGKVEYQKNLYGNPLPGTEAERTDAVDGSDIYTTIDTRLQTLLESKMDEVNESSKPDDLTAVLMKANTGEIVALAQRPTFNPEDMTGVEDEGFVWRNLFTEDNYEPGSTIKVATVAAAIDENVFNPNDYFQAGSIDLEDATIKDHDLGSKGDLNYRQALSWSSNVGMVLLEQKMNGAWSKYLEKFGIGESTYSGLNEETSGRFVTDNIVDKAMSAYGQAVGVSQFQMLKIFSAIANDGKMLQPHYISKIVQPDTGATTVVEPEVVGQPISANAAATVREYMRDVVESPDYGTAYGQYTLDNYAISAKTGTAQIAAEDGTGYLKGSRDYIYSVVLMYPSEKPEYILYLTMKRPQNGDSTVFKEIANPLMKRSMELLNAEGGEQEENTAEVKVADYQEENVTNAAVSARRTILNPIVLGTGETVTAQSLPAGDSVAPNTRILLLTGGSIKMPDTTGWTRSELEALGNLLSIEVNIQGEGVCIDQSLEAKNLLDVDTVSFTLG